MEKMVKNFETPNGTAQMVFFQYEEKPENCEGLVAKANIGLDKCLIVKSVVFDADENNNDLYSFQLQLVDRFDYSNVYVDYDELLYIDSLELDNNSVISVIETYFKANGDIDLMSMMLE
jgi:hypothetical protein